MKKELIWQYILGFLFCAGILTILFLSPAGKKSLLLPDGRLGLFLIQEPLSEKESLIFIGQSGLFFYMLPFAASFINGAGARMRLYIEPILVVIACNIILNFLSVRCNKNENKYPFPVDALRRDDRS